MTTDGEEEEDLLPVPEGFRPAQPGERGYDSGGVLVLDARSARVLNILSVPEPVLTREQLRAYLEGPR